MKGNTVGLYVKLWPKRSSMAPCPSICTLQPIAVQKRSLCPAQNNQMSEDTFRSSGTKNTPLHHLLILQKLRRSLYPLCTPSQRQALVKVADVFLQKRAQNTFCDYSVALKILLDGGFPLRQAKVTAELLAGSSKFWMLPPASKHISKS